MKTAIWTVIAIGISGAAAAMLLPGAGAVVECQWAPSWEGPRVCVFVNSRGCRIGVDVDAENVSQYDDCVIGGHNRGNGMASGDDPERLLGLSCPEEPNPVQSLKRCAVQ